MTNRYTRLAVLVATSGLLSLADVGEAAAQLKGHYVPGFTALMDGTQPPPGISIALPIYYYTTNDIRNDAGDRIGISPRINVTFVGPVVAWVTNKKLFGGNYGGYIAPLAFIKSRIEGKSLDVPGSWAFTDIELQPLQLGWETKKANFITGWSLFFPTGKWELGGSDNSGLGMWSNLFQAGTTLHLDTKHLWNFSTLAGYEIHSHKRGSDLRVGDILVFEGGLGRTFVRLSTEGGKPTPSLVTDVGVVYYASFKVTSDQAAVGTSFLENRKDRVYAVGVEGSFVFPKSGWVLGLRVEPEFGARNRTQGLTLVLTTAYQLKKPPKLFREPAAPIP